MNANLTGLGRGNILENDRRKQLIDKLNSGEISSIADYVEFEDFSADRISESFVEWFNIKDAIYTLVRNGNEYLVRLHQFKQLLTYLVSNNLLIESSIGERRNIYFLAQKRLPTFVKGEMRSVGEFVIPEIQDLYAKLKDAKYIASDELAIYIRNDYRTHQEILENDRRNELAEEKRRNLRSEKTTKIIAVASLLISLVAAGTGIVGLITYTTTRDVVVRNLESLPKPLDVRIIQDKTLPKSAP